MIEKIDCIIIKCNNCGDVYEHVEGWTIFASKTDVNPEEDDWYVEDDTHYCPDCHEIDEDDNLIVKPQLPRI